MTVGLFKDYVSQTRKPGGFLGKLMLNGMNSGHARMADWGLSHLPEIDPKSAVDLGCGGGRNVGELLKRFPKAHVTAVDYSELSVEKAKEYNQKIDGMKNHTVEQIEAALRSAGFCEVKSDHHPSKPWIIVLARK